MNGKYHIKRAWPLGIAAAIALCCLALSEAQADPRYFSYAPRTDDTAVTSPANNNTIYDGIDDTGYYHPPKNLPSTDKLADAPTSKLPVQTILPDTAPIEDKTLAQPIKQAPPAVVTSETITPASPAPVITQPPAAPAPKAMQEAAPTPLIAAPLTPTPSVNVPALPPVASTTVTETALPPNKPALKEPKAPTMVIGTAQSPSIMVTADNNAPELSNQSKNIVNKLPSDKPVLLVKKAPIALERVKKNSLDDAVETKQHEGVGISIKIKRQKANVTQMLENAYQALIAGNQEEAIEIYKQVLEEQPNNKLGLFGLATTYHRAGQIELARPLYGKLLAIDPHNVEGLNNFLVLLADESPEEALAELAELERTHPTFSPVPAQMAAIYEKTGNYDKAIDYMRHAIELSPENLKYRYNMAIILDKKGEWADAAEFYRQLIAANERGEKIPTNSEEIQKRLTFISSNKPKS